MIPNWNKILKEWSYRVGVIKPNNSEHLYHLNNILEERGWPHEVINGVIDNLTEAEADVVAPTLKQAREKAKKEADCKEDVFQKKANKDALEEARFFVQLQFLVSVASGDTDKVLQVQGNYLCKCKSGKKSKNCCAPCTCPDANGEKFKFCCGLCICGLHKDCEKKGKTIYEENSKPAKDCCRKTGLL